MKKSVSLASICLQFVSHSVLFNGMHKTILMYKFFVTRRETNDCKMGKKRRQ